MMNVMEAHISDMQLRDGERSLRDRRREDLHGG